MIEIVIELRSGSRNEDRAAAFSNADAAVFMMADGAGGVGSGARAAEVVVHETQALVHGHHKSALEALAAAETRIETFGGMSTGIIVMLRHGQLTGVSCGDSKAWLFSKNCVLELTSNQIRKPLLGSGGVLVEFGPVPFNGRLLLASDGLVNYAQASKIAYNAVLENIHEAANSLAELPRLKSGKFPDDVAILLADASA
jgi:PPM family protein phosphatase